MRSIHVRPYGDKWAVSEETRIESFLHDLAHYGVGVAIHNVCWLWVHRNDKHVRCA